MTARLSTWIALSTLVTAAVLPRAPLLAQTARDSTRGTRIIITAVRAGHDPLSDQLADSLAVLLRRQFRCSELEVLTWRDADRLSLTEPLPDSVALTINDLRELAKQMAADVIVDLRVDHRRPADTYLAPMIIDRWSATRHSLPALRQLDLQRTPRRLAAQVAADPLLRRRYPLRPIDVRARHLTCTAPDKRAIEAAPAALHFVDSLAREVGR